MRAKLLVCLAGDPMREAGETITGMDAVRLCAKGLAVPIPDDEPETGTREVVVEKAVKSRRHNSKSL